MTQTGARSVSSPIFLYQLVRPSVFGLVIPRAARNIRSFLRGGKAVFISCKLGRRTGYVEHLINVFHVLTVSWHLYTELEVSDHMSAINSNKLVEEYIVTLASPSTLA